MDNNRDFKGVWIPKAVWLDGDLNALDKVILVEIDSLCGEDGCFASNDYLASFCQCSPSKVSKAVQKLTGLGYLKVESFDGRNRVLRSMLVNFTRQPSKKCQAASQNMPAINIDSNIESNIVLSDDNTKGVNADGSYGKVEINGLFDSWESITGLPITSNKTKNRYACNNLINKYGVDGVEKLIRVVEKAQTDRYAPRVADFCDLQAKLNQLLLWAKNQVTNSQVISVEDF